MIPLYYDLHIHSCLSPCGDDDMTPANIAGMAAVKGLDVIALTDHNSCKNCPAILKHGEEYGITVIQGMELTTSEEVHVVCLFPALGDAMAFDGYVYEHVRRGMDKEAVRGALDSYGTRRQLENLMFAQEKYSNGETTLQMLEDFIEPDGLYLLDEPEVSLSPENQVALAEKLNRMARFLGCQFIVATHSPFVLGTLQGRIYDLDSGEWEEKGWTELENVRYFFEFFERHRMLFIDT